MRHSLPFPFDKRLALGPAICRSTRGMDRTIVVDRKRRQRSILFVFPQKKSRTIASCSYEGFAIDLNLVLDRLIWQENQGHGANRGVKPTNGLEDTSGFQRRLVLYTQIRQAGNDMFGISHDPCLYDPRVEGNTRIVVCKLVHGIDTLEKAPKEGQFYPTHFSVFPTHFF